MQFNKFSLIFFKNEQKILENVYNNNESNHQILQFDLENYDTTIDLENELFIRENEDFLFILDIKNKECNIHLKKENLTLDIGVDHCILTKRDNKIELEYTIESDDSRNKIVITEMSEKNEE